MYTHFLDTRALASAYMCGWWHAGERRRISGKKKKFAYLIQIHLFISKSLHFCAIFFVLFRLFSSSFALFLSACLSLHFILRIPPFLFFRFAYTDLIVKVTSSTRLENVNVFFIRLFVCWLTCLFDAFTVQFFVRICLSLKFIPKIAASDEWF